MTGGVVTVPEVLHVITDQDRRGAQVFAADLHAALSRDGAESRLVALAPGQRGECLDVPALGARRVAPSTFTALAREMRAAPVTLAHGSTTLLACGLVGPLTRSRFVYRQISDTLFWAPTTVKQLRVRLLLGRATMVVALWSGEAEVLATRFGVARDRIRIIPNGVPADRFPQAGTDEARAARRILGLDPDTPTLVSIGALVPEKGVDLAIRAAAAVEGCQLLVAGAGPEEDALRRLAAQCAPGRVRFVGPVPDPAPVYAAADVVLLPSRGGDSMPAVLIEAALTGRAVVATTIGGIVDIVVDGRTGELVPPDDLVALVAATRRALDTAEGYGRSGRAHALSHFEIGVVARAYADVMAEATAR